MTMMSAILRNIYESLCIFILGAIGVVALFVMLVGLFFYFLKNVIAQFLPLR